MSRFRTIILAILLVSHGTAAFASALTAPAERDVAARHAFVEDRLAFYSKAFPDIYFVHLAGGEKWRGDMIMLMSLLGSGAVNLDYIAPPEVARQVLDVSLERIARFLQKDVVSAASFRVGRGAMTKRPFLCIVTLNNVVFATDPVEATRQMLDVTDGEFAMVHPARLINVADHLRFAVDHEVFHCLESTRYGGMPLSNEPFGGEYQGFRRESAADSFALAMHLRKYGRQTEYAGNIALIRALWMVTESPDACTFEAVKMVYQTPVDTFELLALPELVAYTVDLRDRLVGSYEDYLKQRTATKMAAAALRGRPGPAVEPISDRAVRERIARYRFYLDQLFVDAPVRFAPADIRRP